MLPPNSSNANVPGNVAQNFADTSTQDVTFAPANTVLASLTFAGADSSPSTSNSSNSSNVSSSSVSAQAFLNDQGAGGSIVVTGTAADGSTSTESFQDFVPGATSSSVGGSVSTTGNSVTTEANIDIPTAPEPITASEPAAAITTLEPATTPEPTAVPEPAPTPEPVPEPTAAAPTPEPVPEPAAPEPTPAPEPAPEPAAPEPATPTQPSIPDSDLPSSDSTESLNPTPSDPLPNTSPDTSPDAMMPAETMPAETMPADTMPTEPASTMPAEPVGNAAGDHEPQQTIVDTLVDLSMPCPIDDSMTNADPLTGFSQGGMSVQPQAPSDSLAPMVAAGMSSPTTTVPTAGTFQIPLTLSFTSLGLGEFIQGLLQIADGNAVTAPLSLQINLGIADSDTAGSQQDLARLNVTVTSSQMLAKMATGE